MLANMHKFWGETKHAYVNAYVAMAIRSSASSNCAGSLADKESLGTRHAWRFLNCRRLREMKERFRYSRLPGRADHGCANETEVLRRGNLINATDRSRSHVDRNPALGHAAVSHVFETPYTLELSLCCLGIPSAVCGAALCVDACTSPVSTRARRDQWARRANFPEVIRYTQSWNIERKAGVRNFW